MNNTQLYQICYSGMLIGFLWLAWTDIGIVSNWGRFFISMALWVMWGLGITFIGRTK